MDRETADEVHKYLATLRRLLEETDTSISAADYQGAVHALRNLTVISRGLTDMVREVQDDVEFVQPRPLSIDLGA